MFCIYHDNCMDGFTAAWAVWRARPNTVFYAAKYGQKPPLHLMNKQTEVAIVDFSYPADALREMAAVARSVLVLDHHKTAKEALAEFEQCPPWATAQNVILVPDDVTVLLDMERSGAGITWDFFHPHEPRPRLIRHVEDRDLWKFELASSKEIHEVLSVSETNFEAWNAIDADLRANPWSVIQTGATLLRKHRQLVDAAVRNHWMTALEGYSVPVVNAVPNLASDVGNDLAIGHPFAIVYIDGPDGRLVSLRSSKNGGVDVSEIAKKYGGGGHKNAAGFKLPRPGMP